MFASIKTKIKFTNSYTYAFVLLAVMLFSYGYQLHRLGFFWDDWQAVFISRFQQPSMWWQFFLGDRPISAWTFLVTTPVLGMNPLPWHLFTLLVRWAGVLAFTWALKGIWKNRAWEIGWMGLILAVFPGFTQQSISVAYSQHFLTMGLFMVSLGCMVWSMRLPRWSGLLLTAGLASSLLSLLTMEYWMGLDLLRPLLLWFILQEKGLKFNKRFTKVLKYWLPYLLVLGITLFWRFYLYTRFFNAAPANNPFIVSDLLTQPAVTLTHLFQIALQDTTHIILFIWANIILPQAINLKIKMVWISWLAGALLAAALYWFSKRQQVEEIDGAGEAERDHFESESMMIGLAGIVLGGLPVWFSDHQVIVGLWSDRFVLAPMFGAAVLMVGLVSWFCRSVQRKALFLSILVGLAGASHLQTANRFYLNSELQRDFYWQLHWRAPALKPGTLVVSPDIPFSYVSTESMGFMVNTMYNLKPDSARVPYWFLDVLRYKGSEIIKDLKDGEPVKYELRNIRYEGTSSEALGIVFNGSRGCLRVLDPVYSTAPMLTERENEVYPISHSQQIIAAAEGMSPALPRDVFGSEPPRDWCYYYEKADLARQFNDWQKVEELGREASQAGLTARNGAEYLPFIEAAGHAGNWQEARDLTDLAMAKTEKMSPLMCATWKRMANEQAGSSGQDPVVQSLLDQMKCGK